MVPEQKRAWFIIVVAIVSVGCVLALTPWVGIRGAVAALGLFGLSGLSPVLFRKKREPGEVEFDERDVAIQRKAAMVGFGASYLVFIVACMGIWTVCHHYRHQATISIHVLPSIVATGGMTCFIAHSIAIVILYGRGDSRGEN